MSIRRVMPILVFIIIAISLTSVCAQNPQLVTEEHNGLNLYYEDNIGPKNVQFVRDTWDQCMLVYTDNLKVKPNNEVDVFVFGTFSGYREKLINQGIPASWAFNTLGVAQGKKIFINLNACMSMVKKEKYQLLAHEFAHIWTFKLNGNRFEDCWLMESYAYYSETLILSTLGLDSMESIHKRSINRIKGKHLPKLEEMQTREGFSQAFKEVGDDDVFRAYMVTVTDYLLSITGPDKIIQYFGRNLAQDGDTVETKEDGTVVITRKSGVAPSLESNFLTSFGMDVPTFQVKLTEYIKNAKP